jgi:hypothetical protein
MVRVLELGLHFNKPWEKPCRPTLPSNTRASVWAVQVKSAMFKNRGGYCCAVRGSNGPDQGDPFECLRSYVFLWNLW